MSQQIAQGHDQDRYLFLAIGQSISIVLALPVLWKNWSLYKASKTKAHMLLFASTIFVLLYSLVSGTASFMNYTFYLDQNMVEMYPTLAWSANAILCVAGVLLTGVILERLCVVQPSGERSRKMVWLHALNISFRTLTCLSIAATALFVGIEAAKKVGVIVIVANVIFSLIMDFSVNFLVARRIYVGSVQMVRDYHGKNNTEAKKLARRLNFIMAVSALVELTAATLYGLESVLRLSFLAIFFPPTVVLRFTFETIYQIEVRKIYLSRDRYGSTARY